MKKGITVIIRDFSVDFYFEKLHAYMNRECDMINPIPIFNSC